VFRAQILKRGSPFVQLDWMKMADGGFRPAYNWQFAVDTAQRVITGVDVVNRGSD